MATSEEKKYVNGLVERARKAQKIVESFNQERVDHLVTAIVWNIVKPGTIEEISKFAVEETELGNYESKYAKLNTKLKGALRDMKGKKSMGIIERDEEKGLIKIAKPVGVVGAVNPTTNPEATPVLKAIMAIKTRNAVVMSPHPKAKKTNTMIVNIMREVLKKYNAPEDLIIGIENPTLGITQELMKQCDLVLATGGGAMVNAAYSSGTPAYGVGVGNAVVVIDETADIKDAANKIMRSKTFDFATSCSAENSLVIQEDIYHELIRALEDEGGYLLNSEEKAKLQKNMWIDGVLNRDVVAQPVQKIAEVGGLKIPEDRKFIMVEETKVGPEYPFSGEKLSMVVALFKYKEFQEAIDKVNEITEYQGKGHSCGIHSTNEDHIVEFALKTYTSRVMVRQPQCLANSGAWTNGMPMTLSLGCGTWGGNISSENITWKHLLNTTWVSYPIPDTQPTDEELFGDVMKE
ncbi:Sulfoacetaldehyde dehydrogenase (acylating) [[Clostridium] ultunense Esp]|uniref:Sulfoacetaldehyde dehydrogenase (Acylating) n=1 Tax=[Clostridium] ultunense Esp TaxID=1288971 RepID=M1ZFW5_9FIRM|nr:aldehyde dehydrogenase family protein [Schnuerera ultunensis]CCQ97636.1 Sulfoacetaldehyde dehydrogenase (acylating) [[Clostridium] ultunense Esp]SHD75764.1 Sulfoacetaldehyde dehydrogenase (acylating) [[Clostridium] ultunense Esp]